MKLYDEGQMIFIEIIILLVDSWKVRNVWNGSKIQHGSSSEPQIYLSSLVQTNVHTRLDRSQFALRKCSHSFRSISVRFEKVFTPV